MNEAVEIGALVSPEDPNDYIFERLARGQDGIWSEMPETLDMRVHTQLSRDQGARGTCSAFAAAAIKEIQESKDCGFNEWMSPEFIYYHRDNKPAQGMYGRNVFQILKTYGSLPEVLYPYNCEQEPDKEHYQIAAQYRISNFARVTTVEGLKRALIEIGPCYLMLPLFRSRPVFWKPLGDESTTAGHALAVIGYTPEGFILKNSWGPEWNGDGCIIFPYDDWGIHYECWVSIDEKTNLPVKERVIKHEHNHVHTYVRQAKSDPSMTLTMTETSVHVRPKTDPVKRKRRNSEKNDKCVMM